MSTDIEQAITRIVTSEEAGERLDVFVSTFFSPPSRSQAKKHIDDGLIFVNGNTSKANTRLKAGDIIEAELAEPAELSAEPEDIPLDIVYEDSSIAVINKPQGMVCHPAAGNEHGTLVNAAMFHIKDLSGIGGVIRPGIVHRIDKLTSGLLVIAKNDVAHSSLSAQIAEHSAARTYICVVCGNIKEDTLSVNKNIGRHKKDRKKMAVYESGESGMSRNAVTHFRVLHRFGEYTLLEAALETGRTHQIRVHSAYIKHPVVGDPVYGAKSNAFSLDGQALHAISLCLTHPETGKRMTFFAPIPEYFRKLIKRLGGDDVIIDAIEDYYKNMVK